jgi:hypothetical protein
MAQSGFTPIKLYNSITAAAVPLNTDLANGELAVNIADGKLYYKDSTGVVQVLATKANAVSPLAVVNGGTGVTTSTGTGNVVLSTSPTLVTPLLGTPTSGVATNLTGLPLTTGVTGVLPVANGGTNIASYTIGDITYASATGVLSKLADVATGNALISGGVGVAPSYGKIALTTHISGVLPVANGGTNIATYAVGDIIYASTTGVLSKLPDVATGNALISGGVGVAPSYGKIALTTHVSGTLPVANGGTGVTSSTGTGNTVLSASPTFTGTLAAAAITASTTLGVSGVSTLTNGAVIEGMTVGKGSGAFTHNTAVGFQTLLNSIFGTGDYNTAVGYQALASNTNGLQNTAVGSYAVRDNSTGFNNTGVGYSALLLTSTGNYNTAVGANALSTNGSGVENTANGASALTLNSTGNYNTATGSQSLSANTIGVYNTATGTRALINNTSGSYNTATGQRALNTNTTSDSNTAYGSSALYFNTGTANTATGTEALYGNISGSYNTAEGYQALKNNTTGSANTAISPTNSSGVYAPVFDPVGQSDRFCMGSTAVTNAYIQVAWTVVSDARDKTNFGVIPHGLAFVNKLTPVSFQFKELREVDVPHGPVRYGFRAQDILALEGTSPVVVDAEDPEKLRFNESSLIPILVKAVQELTARIAALEAR